MADTNVAAGVLFHVTAIDDKNFTINGLNEDSI